MGERIELVKRAFAGEARGKGGLVLCSGCALGPQTKSENLQAFVRAAREMCQ